MKVIISWMGEKTGYNSKLIHSVTSSDRHYEEKPIKAQGKEWPWEVKGALLG